MKNFLLALPSPSRTLFLALTLTLALPGCDRNSTEQTHAEVSREEKSRKEVFPAGMSMQVNCLMLSPDGKILRVNESVACISLEDGSQLRCQHPEEFALIDGNGRKIWGLANHCHHGFDIDKDKKFILVLGSDHVKVQNRKIRMDTLSRVQLKDGKVVDKIRLNDFLPQVLKHLGLRSIDPDPILDRTQGTADEVEYTHANSVQLIPPNPLENEFPVFRRGNVLVNLYNPTGAILVLSPDLKKVLWISKKRYRAHDVQMLPEGKFLLFLNRTSFFEDKRSDHSELQEIDPVTEEVHWRFAGSKKQSIQSLNLAGTVQKVHGKFYVYGGEGGWVKVVSREGENLLGYPVGINSDELSFGIFRVRIEDFSSYLRHSTQ